MTVADDDFFPVFAQWARDKGLDEARRRFGRALGATTLEAYVAEYLRRLNDVENTDPPAIHGPRDPWYIGPNPDADQHWPALSDYFVQKLGWGDDRLAPVDSASSKVVAYTPWPQRESWKSKGLVVGYVQSGKTTNFTSVIAKAADVGYKLVIVLSGIHNGLRRQTQVRLDEQLHDLSPRDWLMLTDPAKDFEPPRMQSTALLHNQESKVALAVVKKNKTVLTKLDAWLEDASKQRVLEGLPVLVIDDEADQASVATKTINPLIHKVLAKLPRCTYIGYTATPFANVLIDPAAEDLYPEDFILNLPRPRGYFGTEEVFGREAVEGDEANGASLDGHDMVRSIDADELEELRPAGRAAAASFSPSVTPSLRAALSWFWLGTAARRARGDLGHSTMLVHTSMKIDVHESFRDPLIEFRDRLVRDVENGVLERIDELRTLWEDETTRVRPDEFGLRALNFDEVVGLVPEVVRATRIVLDNCRSEDRLDYSQPSQVAIAVGGNTLSRGLTLEGLVVSFFVRAAQAYDTLLQMARWFGFRPGYEDMPRMWMTDELESWFRHLATVEHEIRLDIDRYEHEGLTPKEFGVRIRTHPTLRITTKMGAAKQAYASYGGRRIQTRYFPEHDSEWLENNVAAADELVRAARSAGATPEPGKQTGAVLLHDVDADLVERFLRSYASHTDSPDLDSELVLRYIRRQRHDGELDRWNIAVMGGADGSGRPIMLGGVASICVGRAKLRNTGPERADIKTLMSKDHRVVDLPITPADARAMNESTLMARRNSDPTARHRGLLLLYPIDGKSAPSKQNEKARSPLDAPTTVMGMALVFPGNAESRVANSYVQVDLSDVDVEQEEAEVAELEGTA